MNSTISQAELIESKILNIHEIDGEDDIYEAIAM